MGGSEFVVYCVKIHTELSMLTLDICQIYIACSHGSVSLTFWDLVHSNMYVLKWQPCIHAKIC